MKTATTITGKIVDHKRENNSRYGNPCYSLVIDLTTIEGVELETGHGADWRSNRVTVKTSPDAAINYAILNPEFTGHYSDDDGRRTFIIPVVRFTIDGRGNITHAEAL